MATFIENILEQAFHFLLILRKSAFDVKKCPNFVQLLQAPPLPAARLAL